MPTVTEPKGNEPKLHLAPPPSGEPELFAAEVAMEGKGLNLFPIVLILGLMVVVGGTIFYFIKGARDVLTVPVATTTVDKVLALQGAANIHFSTGTVVSSVNEKPLDPHYKLLSKAGVVVTKAKGANALIVSFTPAGEKLLGDIKDVQKNKNADGTTSYLVPLAVRTLVSVDKVRMIKPHLAQVDYTWKWTTNRLGREFEASGALVQTFSTWDRATLIKSYGVDFYSGAPARASVVLQEGNDGNWKAYTE